MTLKKIIVKLIDIFLVTGLVPLILFGRIYRRLGSENLPFTASWIVRSRILTSDDYFKVLMENWESYPNALDEKCLHSDKSYLANFLDQMNSSDFKLGNWFSESIGIMNNSKKITLIGAGMISDLIRKNISSRSGFVTLLADSRMHFDSDAEMIYVDRELKDFTFEEREFLLDSDLICLDATKMLPRDKSVLFFLASILPNLRSESLILITGIDSYGNGFDPWKYSYTDSISISELLMIAVENSGRLTPMLNTGEINGWNEPSFLLLRTVDKSAKESGV